MMWTLTVLLLTIYPGAYGHGVMVPEKFELLLPTEAQCRTLEKMYRANQLPHSWVTTVECQRVMVRETP